MPKKKLIQSKLKDVKFQFDQYWSIKYTEVIPGNPEEDYKVIIKARSSELSRKILKFKLKDANRHCKIKGVSINMLHSKCVVNGLRLTLKDWECAKDCSFPNPVDVLFKFSCPRSERQQKHLIKLRDTKPESNVVKLEQNFSEDEKKLMIWDGKWKPWPMAEREAFKERIFIGLRLNNNCRKKAAEYISVSQRHFQKLLKKFPEVNWAKEFPVKYYQFTKSDDSRRIQKLRDSKAAIKEEYMKKMGSEILPLLKEGHSFNSICKLLKTSKSTINNCIEYHEFKR